MYRKTFVEYNLDNFYHNLKVYEKITDKKIMAIIKANGYGAIDYYIANKLEKKGVDFFGVSSLEEAVRLRKHHIQSNILVMGYVNDLNVVKDNDLAIIIPSKDFVDAYKEELKGIRVHIKVNTGLNRLGVFEDETKIVLADLLKYGAIPEGIMTHLAKSEDKEYTINEYNEFKEVVTSLNYDFKYIHAEASDAAIYLKDDISNYVRIGLGLFGYTNIDNDIGLLPAIKLKAEVIYSKKVNKGEGVSYSHHYISDGEGYINTVAIGYADGISKDLENKRVFLQDEEGHVVGKVCMDLLMVKTKNKHKAGDLVEIFGDHIDLYERRNELNTCICQIICSLAERVTRLYIEDNKVVDEISIAC